jgi:uncharacterized protein
MEIMNLVITGATSAGKSTFIQSIREIEVVDTDKRATDRVADLEQNTTVAIEFGRVQLGENRALHIYETSDRVPFDLALSEFLTFIA